MAKKRFSEKKALRWSVPPYYVGTVEAGLPIMSLPGNSYELLERSRALSAEEASVMLVTLRRKLRWSRPMLSAFMGVGRDTVRSWETGERNPSGAARRLIWLLTMLILNRKGLEDALDLVVWGRRKEIERFVAATAA